MAVATIATAVAVLAGCTTGSSAGTVNPSPVPSSSTNTAERASPSPSPAVSDGPPASPTAPQATPSAAAPSAGPPSAASSPFVVAGLGADTLAIVVATDGLRVRGLPTVGDQSAQYDPTLPEGLRLYVVDGPVTADGYAWYQVQPYGDPLERVGPAGDWAQVQVAADRPTWPFGWVAAGSRKGEPWIEPFALGCDSVAPSAEGLASGEPLEHLYCSLAGEPPRASPPGPDIAVEGKVYCTLADDHWGALSGPGWIDQLGYCELRADGGSIRLPGAPITALLGGKTNPVEGRFAILGHFDDPGARECRAGAFEGGDPPDPAEVVLRCRTYFVVTEVRPLP